MFPLPSNPTSDYLRQARQDLRFTVIENAPQKTILPPDPRTKLTIPPVHRTQLNSKNASGNGSYNTPASDQTSDASSLWSHRSSQSSYDGHDSLYDVTDDETEVITIKLSDSVKRQAHVSKERARYPSLVIPSPSAWPTIQKLHNTHFPGAVGLSPAIQVDITPTALATFNARARQISGGKTPSLAGSLTSEEASLHSCPSTPDLEETSPGSESWDQPMQLDPRAFQILHQLQPLSDDGRDDPPDPPDPVVTITEEELHEMQQITRDTQVRPDFTLFVKQCSPLDDEEAVSALTIPSPGGFFSSLAPCAAQTWSRRTPEPSTGVAEKFYGVPWRARSPPDIPSVPNLSLTIPPVKEFSQDRILSPSQRFELSDITEQYNEAYAQALLSLGLEHSERTQLWLNAQAAYLSRIFQDDPVEEGVGDARPATPERVSSPVLETASTSKKSVRFVDGLDAILAEASDGALVDKKSNITDDRLFYQAFKHLWKVMQKHDAFIHRQIRAEAVHLQRSSLTSLHCKQMLGQYHISTATRPSSTRPVSNMLPATSTNNDDDIFKANVAAAERERQALDQVKLTAWALQAERQLQGGKLLSSPVEKKIHQLPNARILDYGGQAAADWGWQAALDYREATVYTLPIVTSPVSNDDSATPELVPEGPINHHVVPVARPWALPFPASYFDVVSARSLHLLLRTTQPFAPARPPKPNNSNEPDPSPQEPADPNENDTPPLSESEYDLALAEIHRVLKPGGYLEFTIYDATLLRPSGPLGLALSVEFAFELRTRGYDPGGCGSFLPRLRRAGFMGMVRRGWFVLPMGDVRPMWTDRGKVGGNAGGRGEAGSGSGSGSGSASGSGSGSSRGGTATTTRGGTNFFRVEDRNADGEMFAPPLMGSTAAVQDMTGLVGARAWEQWMLKVGGEMGRPAEQTVGRVARVLEEAGGGSGSGWKCLKGWARKDGGGEML